MFWVFKSMPQTTLKSRPPMPETFKSERVPEIQSSRFPTSQGPGRDLSEPMRLESSSSRQPPRAPQGLQVLRERQVPRELPVLLERQVPWGPQEP
jgi:hypothetical protein